MNRKQTLLALLMFCLMGSGTQSPVVFAQEQAQSAPRPVKRRVLPEYPDVAKRMNLTGKVKFEIVIAPDGHVRTVRVLGGHPVLLQAAESAVRDWKFATNSAETTQTVEIEFAGTEVR